ncbi:MAG: SH3 domain-containing protein [Terriglobia bacterium]
MLILAGGAALYYRYLYRPIKQATPSEIAYALPATLNVEDTPAILRRTVATVQNGARLLVLGRTEHWAHVRLENGVEGWVPLESLQSAAPFDKGVALFRRLGEAQVQAAGHTDTEVNLRIEPSRDAPRLDRLPANLHLEVYDRRIVARQPQPGQGGVKDVWYLVRTNDRAGWMLGRFVDLDVPPGIAMYAQGVNMVAWMMLDTVNDSGRRVPQYVAADRIRTQHFDFNHIRVFTWWIKRHKYVTAYVEGGVNGYFPIRVTHVGGVPYFRLRLVDDDGNKIQKVYGLFDTIVKTIGTVPGWESDAMPAKLERRPNRKIERRLRILRRRR